MRADEKPKPDDDRPCWCNVRLGWLVCPACVPLPVVPAPAQRRAK